MTIGNSEDIYVKPQQTNKRYIGASTCSYKLERNSPKYQGPSL